MARGPSGCRTLISVFGVVFAVALLGLGIIPGGDVLFYLVVGWTQFLNRVVPKIQVRWDIVGSVVVFALALVIGSHLFLRWLWRESRPDPSGTDVRSAPSSRHWRLRWTLSGFVLLVLMFVAGTAAIGITHQVVWLARSPEPLFVEGTDRRSQSHQIKCRLNLHIIGQHLFLFAKDHDGRFPDDLSELVFHAGMSIETLICPGSNDEGATGLTPSEKAVNVLRPGHCSYTYFGKGRTTAVDPTFILAAELKSYHHGGRGGNILFANGEVEWAEGSKLESLIKQNGLLRTMTAPSDSSTAPSSRSQ
jgi:hypothetical protein